MAESSIGPTNWMLRADSSQLTGDVDKAKAKLETAMGGVKPITLKAYTQGDAKKELMGSLLRLNPLLAVGEMGIGKGTAKILSRELGGVLGDKRFAGLASGIGGFAAIAGPAALAAYGLNKLKDAMFHLAGQADPKLMKQYNAAWDSFTSSFGNLFVPMLRDATHFMEGMAKFSNLIFGSETGKGFASAWWQSSKRQVTQNLGVGGALAGAASEGLGMLFDLLPSSPKSEAINAKSQSLGDFSDALTLAAYGSESPAEKMVTEQQETNSLLRTWLEKLGIGKATDRGLKGK